MIIIADSNIFMSALVSPTGLTASILAERWTSDKVLVHGLTEKGYGHFFITTETLKTFLYKKEE